MISWPMRACSPSGICQNSRLPVRPCIWVCIGVDQSGSPCLTLFTAERANHGHMSLSTRPQSTVTHCAAREPHAARQAMIGGSYGSFLCGNTANIFFQMCFINIQHCTTKTQTSELYFLLRPNSEGERKYFKP